MLINIVKTISLTIFLSHIVHLIIIIPIDILCKQLILINLWDLNCSDHSGIEFTLSIVDLCFDFYR